MASNEFNSNSIFFSINIDKMDDVLVQFALLWNPTQIINTVKSIHSLKFVVRLQMRATINTQQLQNWHKQHQMCLKPFHLCEKQRQIKKKTEGFFCWRVRCCYFCCLIPTVDPFVYVFIKMKYGYCDDGGGVCVTKSNRTRPHLEWMNEWM